MLAPRPWSAPCLAGHRRQDPPHAHPQTPGQRRAGLPLLLRPTRAPGHPHHPGAVRLPALAGRGNVRMRQGPLRTRPLSGPPYTAVLRHIVLTMAALAVCAVTAAAEKSRGPQPVLPDHSDQQPPQDIGLITLTVAEVKRLFNLLTHTGHDIAHHLHWVVWRQRHQARARWYHHRTRLRRDQPI